MQYVYADNNATTRLTEEAFEEMRPLLQELYGNPSSLHFLGRAARENLNQARERVARFLRVLATEIIFTSGGTESNHLAISGLLNARPDKRHVVTSEVEHLSTRSFCEKLEKDGYEITRIGVDEEGRLDRNELADSLREDTALVTLMAANNETGVTWPIRQFGQLIRERDIPFHVDAAVAAHWTELDPDRDGIDAVSLSSHKCHGPKGIGALYLRRGVRLSPMFYGGKQERGRRTGTENAPGIAGMGKALDVADARRDEDTRKVKELRDRFEEELIDRVTECVRNGAADERLPNTSNLSFAYIEGEAILLSLSKIAICASSGSACSTNTVEPSYVLRAMGKPDSLAHGAVRFSFSRYTTGEEIDYLIENVPPAIEELREMSPYWQKQKLKTR